MLYEFSQAWLLEPVDNGARLHMLDKTNALLCRYWIVLHFTAS